MTVKGLFGKGGALQGFKSLHSSRLSVVKGKRVGVDLSIYLYPWCKKDEYAIPATSSPRYDSQALESEILQFHDVLSTVFSKVIYVYEGKDLPLKNATKLERMQKVEECKQQLAALLSKQKNGNRLNEVELNDVKKHRRGMSAPDEIAYGKAIKFMEHKGMITLGAPGEAEHQLVQLEGSNIIDTILTRDADLIPLGARHVLFDLKIDYSDAEKSKVSIYESTLVHSPTTPFKDMHLYRNHLPEFASLLGSDYSRRIHGVGPSGAADFMKEYIECNSMARRVMLVELEAKGVIQGPKKMADKVREGYVSSDDKRAYIDSLDGKTKQSLKKIDDSYIGWADNFAPATAMYRYCPVFKFKEGNAIELKGIGTFDISLGPLYPLPSDKTWEDVLGFDPVALINVQNDTEIKEVATLERLLRFDGRPPAAIVTPTYSAEENADVPTTEPLPLYGRLDFDQCPVEVQPSDILTTWLNARGVHVLSDDREEIEWCVSKARELGTEVLEPELQPKDNPYHWFDVLRPKQLGNKFDTWNKDWTEFLPKMKTIDDEEFTRIFGKGSNGVRERARGLLFDGNVMMTGIECINVCSSNKNDNSDLILLRTRCCPSVKSTKGKSKKHLFYHIHVCIELKDGDGTGFIRTCPFSACSCENGCFFCSHREAFVVGIALVQHYSNCGQLDALMQYVKAKEDPRLSQGKPILIENYTLRATSEHSQSKKKRKIDNDKTPKKSKKRVVNRVTP